MEDVHIVVSPKRPWLPSVRQPAVRNTHAPTTMAFAPLAPLAPPLALQGRPRLEFNNETAVDAPLRPSTVASIPSASSSANSLSAPPYSLCCSG